VVWDAETGEAVRADVYVGVLVDDKSEGYLIEEDISATTFELPRDVLRVDALYINVLADGYLNHLVRIPRNTTAKSIRIEAPLKKLTPR
jgi:hypothetical protein